MQNENIRILSDTLRVLKRGEYVKGNRTIRTKLSKQQMEQARVYLPDEIRDIAERKDFDHVIMLGARIGVGCHKTDSFSMALEQQKHKDLFSSKKQNRVLVLNFANPVHPGGVRSGAMAQEEDLCRRSSLLLSLESQQAQRYYQYNLGALIGYEAMEDKWKKDLECADVILEMAEDLCYGCQMEEYSSYHDEDWTRKYMHMHWKDSDSGDA